MIDTGWKRTTGSPYWETAGHDRGGYAGNSTSSLGVISLIFSVSENRHICRAGARARPQNAKNDG